MHSVYCRSMKVNKVVCTAENAKTKLLWYMSHTCAYVILHMQDRNVLNFEKCVYLLENCQFVVSFHDNKFLAGNNC